MSLRTEWTIFEMFVLVSGCMCNSPRMRQSIIVGVNSQCWDVESRVRGAGWGGEWKEGWIFVDGYIRGQLFQVLLILVGAMSSQDVLPYFTSADVRLFRDTFDHQTQFLHKALADNNDMHNELLLELHFLMTHLHSFFDRSLEVDPNDLNDKEARIFSGEMPVILEGNSEKEISVSNNRDKHHTSKNSSGHSMSFSSPKHRSKISIDSVHAHDINIESPSNNTRNVSSTEVGEEYQAALKTVNSLTMQRSKLEHRLKELQERVSTVEREKEELIVEKKYCLDLLVKHSEKNDKLDTDNRTIKKSLTEYEERYRELSSEIAEKSQLLEEIKEFLRGDEESISEIKPRVMHPTQKTYQDHIGDQLDIDAQRLAEELIRVSEELEVVTEENQALKTRQQEMETDMDMLLQDNEEFYKVIEELKQEVKAQQTKNRELIKIEEGKRLNDMVHKENKHLLQINYDLSNRIFELQSQNERLCEEVARAEGAIEKSVQKSQNATHEETMSYTPKAKLSLKGKANKIPHLNISRNPMDEDKSRYLENSLRIEKEKNKMLESKVGELLGEVAAYEEELHFKRKEIEELNASRNPSVSRDKHSYEVNLKAEHEDNKAEKIFGSQGSVESPPGEMMVMTLKQFTQRFEPSLMDILFVMLRITELAQNMVDNNKIYEIYPNNVFLALDDPDHPENIHAKIERDHSSTREETFFFEAPEMVTNEAPEATESSMVWNMGMVFYYLMYKTPYFESFEEFIDEENRVTMGKQKFPEAEEIIEGMLQREPSQRVAIKDLLEEIAYEINKMFEEELDD